MFEILFNKIFLERVEINEIINTMERVNQIKSWFMDKANELESRRKGLWLYVCVWEISYYIHPFQSPS